MTDFLTDEKGAETSQPREGIEIITTSATYRVATGTRDLVIDGNTYTAAPAGRDEIGVSQSADPRAITIMLPMSHPLCQRYMAGGVPPTGLIAVNVWRQQPTSGETECVWRGNLTSVAPETHVAKLHVPSTSSETYQRKLPVVSCGRACANVLYDARCTLARADFQIEFPVTTFAGRVVTIGGWDGLPADWATFGELLHVASGERMTIQSQSGNVVTMQLPIWEMQVGDTVRLFAGCDHTIETCRDKFVNTVNYADEEPSHPERARGLHIELINDPTVNRRRTSTRHVPLSSVDGRPAT